MADVQLLPDTTKMRARDRTFVLDVIDKTTKGATGLMDTKLFTGGNKLFAKMEPDTCMWYFQYENGILPQALKVKFTSFPALRRYADGYLKGRNIEIKEVLD